MVKKRKINRKKKPNVTRVCAVRVECGREPKRHRVLITPMSGLDFRVNEE
jgi:hypothetical protein